MITKTRTFENALVWTGPKTRALFYRGGGGKVLRISSDMDDRMVGKIKTLKNPYDLKTNPPTKIPGPKFNPQQMPFPISAPKKFPESIKWYNTKNRNIINGMFVFVYSSAHHLE